MITHLPNIRTTEDGAWLKGVKYRLIKLLVGKTPVMMNVSIDTTQPDDQELLAVENCPNGLLVSGCTFHACADGGIFLLSDAHDGRGNAHG
jgi:hypothetical protein